MQYLFIVTYGRTGSTAVQMALNALPGYCIRGENGGVLELLARSSNAVANAQADPSRQTTDPTHPWYGIEDVDQGTFGGEFKKLFVDHVLRPPAGTRVAGFKEIRYAWLSDEQFFGFLEFAQKHFSPRFIFLTRDPQEASRSGMWANENSAFKQLKLARDRLEKATTSYDGFLLDHSEFAKDPEGIRPLVEWLGEDPRPAIESLGTRLTHMQQFNRKNAAEKIADKLRKLTGKA